MKFVYSCKYVTPVFFEGTTRSKGLHHFVVEHLLNLIEFSRVTVSIYSK